MDCWPPRRSAHLPALPLLALLLGMAGCTAPAPQAPAPTTAAIGPGQGTPGFGIIVAMRAPPTGEARRSVLAALGATATAPDGRVEFIVLADDGQPISVMQDQAGGLRTGDRVALIPGSRTRIARASSASTAP